MCEEIGGSVFSGIDQRYFAGTLGGRFLTADPYEASGGASEPGSWNRYPYVGGDPVNHNDAAGMAKCRVSGYDGQRAHVWCGSDDGSLGSWQWMDAPGAPGLPLDEKGPWATEVTNRAASSWGADLDRMASARNATSARFRVAAAAAVAGLGTNCQKLFANTAAHSPLATGAAGPVRTFADSLAGSFDDVNFYDAGGADGSILFSQATGLDISNDGPVSGFVGLNDAAALTYGPPGNEIAMKHVVLSQGFSSLDAQSQAALLVHELIHVRNPGYSHTQLLGFLGVGSAFVAQFGGNESIALTQFIRGNCNQ